MNKLYWGGIAALLRLFFKLLYGPLAWSYDLVSYTVSLGLWRSWVLCVLPDLAGPVVLELGHGPGHLLAALRISGIRAFGLDGSVQMGRLACAKQEIICVQPLLVNGYAQNIPFSSHVFDQVVATFPSEYFWDTQTLNEIGRVLKPGGDLLTLPVAWITGTQPLQQAARWLFQLTGQAPTRLEGPFKDDIQKRLIDAGFLVEFEYRSLKDSTALIVHARRPAN